MPELPQMPQSKYVQQKGENQLLIYMRSSVQS